MTNKYIILDEIKLEIVKERKESLVFDTEEQATKYAKNNVVGWQVIEVPFGD